MAKAEVNVQRRTLISTGLIVLALAGVVGAPPAQSQLDPMSLLRRSLGMSADQMEGGLGSILALAQEKLVRGDFDKIAAAIPGASGYLDKAKKLGAVTGPLKDLSGLNSALGRLGIDKDTAAKFLPAVTEVVGKLGGADVGKLLGGVLGT
jgi:hypothetical protein